MNNIRLSNNMILPQVGLGTFDLKADSIGKALDLGYRLFDTAWQYGNEAEVGKAIRESGINREDIYITTKLWTKDVRSGRVQEELEESLEKLGTDYVDLYLIHWPAMGFEKAWKKMIRLQEDGKIKALGVSNFNEHHLKALERETGVNPVINQIESHPFFSNNEIIDFCESKGIAVQAWCPLGGSYSRLIENKLFEKLAVKYEKTRAQIILRWHIQRNSLVIPRSSNEKRQKENKELFDFELENSDMEKINALNTGKRMGADPDCFEF